ncbi:small ribosomal subunit protein mS39 isoform X2 [Andrena cerasifolii]|uniref:small ribosomal subunit protein mS39 isoform X2 n=1 Tax=Andrena cerasifolii TaxID=2819439 RepID=UPI00403828E0
MNHFKRISYRNTWCRLKRSQSSAAPSSKIQIPPRIERGPTDILHALDCTVPRDPLRTKYKYHDDPFLMPLRKTECRLYALSYESGKKTAMWVHKEHKDLFPKDLSDPKIREFQPLIDYTDKSQVSEELLWSAIQRCNTSEAIEIYKLIEDDVSNETKQALLELLCFHNGEPNLSKQFPHEQWFCRHKDKKMWLHNSEIDKLYKSLMNQGSAAVAGAHNAMICAYAKWLKPEEAWILYEQCKKENIPLNVTTYNYVIGLIPDHYEENNLKRKDILYSILVSMDKEGIRPNVRTLNAALKVAASISSRNDAENLVKHLFVEFKRLNIKFSLASYYHAIRVFSRRGESSYNSFMDILDAAAKESFTMQDPMDGKFFIAAMDAASKCYSDLAAGHKINDILLSGDHYQFITKVAMENGYYYSYTMLVLTNSTIQDFFEFYRKVTPSIYIPELNLMKEIVLILKSYPPEVVVDYLPRFWSDLVNFGFMNSSLSFDVLDMMRKIVLPPESPLITLFADAAASIWDFIKKAREKECSPFHSSTTGVIALLLLRSDRVEEAREVLMETVNHPSMFMPNMDKLQVDELFESCMSKQCIAEAFIVLEYCINSGFEHIVEMARTLHNIEHLSPAYRSKLSELVGVEVLEMITSSASTEK